jgi:Leucine-rich repeat (LRR) protein
LKFLNCSNNQLTSLPNLPEILEVLYCGGNQFTSLPYLPETLNKLYCNYNKLTSLPNLPETLEYLSIDENPIYEIIESHSLNIEIQNVARMNRFRELYYCIKYKNKFREWLWVKVREPSAMKLYSPEYLMNELKDEETDLDEVLNAW